MLFAVVFAPPSLIPAGVLLTVIGAMSRRLAVRRPLLMVGLAWVLIGCLSVPVDIATHAGGGEAKSHGVVRALPVAPGAVRGGA